MKFKETGIRIKETTPPKQLRESEQEIPTYRQLFSKDAPVHLDEKRTFPPVLSYKDLLILREGSSRERIAGATGISLSHLEKGSSAHGFEVPLYSDKDALPSHINCLLTPKAYQQLFNEESSISEDDVFTVTTEYASDWAQREVLVENGYGSLVGSNEYDDLLHDIRGASADISITDFESEIVPLFGSLERAEELIFEAYDRGGVQIIYDSEVFLPFVAKQKNLRGEDGRHVDHGAIAVHEPIPANAILGIVPLDEYERTFFQKYART